MNFKFIIALLLSFSIALQSSALWAESMALLPIKHKYDQIKNVKETDKIPFQTFKDFMISLIRLEPKDHNEMLFYLLNEHQKFPERRKLITAIFASWEQNIRQSASAYISPSNWSDFVKGSVAILVGLLGASIIKGRFIKPPQSLLKYQSAVEKPFTQKMSHYIQQRFAQMANRQAVLSGVATGGTFIVVSVGIEWLLDGPFLNHLLYDFDLPIWFQELFLLSKIPPSEMLKLMNVKMICAYQSELELITYYNEFTETEELSEGQKKNLMIAKDKIEKRIMPDLQTMQTSEQEGRADPNKMDRFMTNGFRPEKDHEFKTRQKNIEIKSLGASKIWEGTDFSCNQVTVEGAIYNAERILKEIILRTNDEN